MKAMNENTEKEMEMKNNHLIPNSNQIQVRTTIADEVAENIKSYTEKKQKRDYDCRHLSKTEMKVDVIVLLKNNERFDRNGRKFSQKWLGPYIVMNISDKVVATLKNASVLTIKKTCNIVQLKH